MNQSTDGILNVDKPKGITSHDVVNTVRRITGIRKVGHAGTLDPMATGVLLLCIGRATRVAEYLVGSNKSYWATVQLGIETDTYDADGQITETSPVSITREQVEKTLATFRGNIEQVPPMYSAIKQQGRPLYRLARQGIAVERPPRPVHISDLTITDWEPPDFSFRVTCSAGTYVRSLVHDLGQKLGCGAHLTGLVRTGSGEFLLDQAIALRELTPDNWLSHLQPIETAIAHLPALTFDDLTSQRLTSGQAVPRRPEQAPAELARAQTRDGRFFALVRPSPDASEWLPHKVFTQEI